MIPYMGDILDRSVNKPARFASIPNSQLDQQHISQLLNQTGMF